MEDLKQELLRHTHAIWGFKEAGIVIDNIDIIVHPDKFLLRLETTIHPKKDIDYFAFGINQKRIQILVRPIIWILIGTALDTRK